MSKKSYRLLLIGVIIIASAFCVFGQKIFDLNLNDYSRFVAPLAGGIISGSVTLLGIELSNAHNKEVQADAKLREKMPYLVIEEERFITNEECEEQELRFPWGGDPAPQDTYDFWYSHGDVDNPEIESRRVYFLVHLKNVGYGLAQDVIISEKDADQDSVYIAHENLIEDKNLGRVKIYIVFDYDIYSEDDSFEQIFTAKFTDLYGNRYEQEIKLSIWFYDNGIHTIRWASKQPRLTQATNAI